jgi:multiple sugar transport system substrate-binding protein
MSRIRVFERPAWSGLAVLLVAVALGLSAVQCSAPAPVQTVVVRETVEVEKQVVVTKEVEKQVLVTPTPQPEAPKPEGEITVWGWPAADKAFEAIIQGFNEEYPAIQVTWEMIPGMAGGTRDALSTALAAGSGAPDISMIEINDIDRFVLQGGLVDLLQEPYNAGRYKDDFVAYKWDQATTPDGRLLAFPWDIGPASIFYRRDVFEKAGLPSDPESVAEMLSTWQDYIDAGKKVNDPANNIFWIDNAPQIPYIYYAHKNFFDGDYNVAINNPKTLQVLQYAKQARQLGLDAKATPWTEEWYSMLGNGQIATVIAGCWFGGFLKSWIDPDGAGNWGVIPIPEDPLQNWGGSFLAITEQSQNKEAAWAFIEYAMATPNAQNQMFVAVDYFPAYTPAWDNPLYEEGDLYFGGQKTRALWTQIATSPGDIFTSPMDSAAEQAFNSEVARMLDQDLDPQETLKAAEQAITEQTAADRALLMKMIGK